MIFHKNEEYLVNAQIISSQKIALSEELFLEINS